MAQLPKFTARAPRQGNLDGTVSTGAAEALSVIASQSAQIANRLGRRADRARQREGAETGAAQAASLAMPSVDFAFRAGTATSGGSASNAQPYKVDDPVATDLPPHARAFLNATAGGESGGAYNVRYTPKGPAYFSDLSRHPEIFVDGPHGKTSAAGRYQFVATTWNRLGGGDFSPAAQDRRAWQLAQEDYQARTGRSLDADLQSSGLNEGILQVLTPTWQAFKSNRGRHIATFNDSLKRFSGQPAVTADAPDATPVDAVTTGAVPDDAAIAEAAVPQMAQPGRVEVTLTGLAPTVEKLRGGTIYADAYNQALTDTALNRMQTAMRGQMDALALQHQDDPAALDSALRAAKAGLVADQPPEIRAALDESFEATRLGYIRDASRRFLDRQEEEWQASFEAEIASRTTNAIRIAQRAGTDATADQALTGELSRLNAEIDRSPFSPVQKGRLKRQLEDDVLSARILGGFDGASGPAERQAFAQRFQEEWQDGEGFGGRVSAKAYDALNGEMMRRLQADETAAAKQSATISRAIDGQMAFLKKGHPVSPEAQKALRDQVTATGDEALIAEFDFLGELADWQRTHLTARPEVVEAQAEALRQRIMRDGATEASLTTLDVIENLHANMTKALDSDPLTFAQRAGVADIQPINFSSVEALTGSLTERAATATAVAAHYGREPTFFTAAEVDGLKKAVESDPLALPQMASSFVEAFGNDTPRALAELSKDAPVVAHAAGVFNATGDQRILVEVGEVLAMRNMDGYQSMLPSKAKLASALSAVEGGALQRLPQTLGAVRETAAALFERRAFRAGISADDFDAPNSPAREIYAQAIDEALGGTLRRGQKYGGLGDINGARTVIPTDVTEWEFQEAWSSMTAADLASQMPVGTANGIAITPAQIRRGTPVFVGPNRYRIALGDPQSDDPRFVPDANGDFFELDATQLMASQRQRGRTRPMQSPWGIAP